MSAVMKFFVNGEQVPVLELPVGNDLSPGEYFAIAEQNQSDTYEYVSIFVEFDVTPAREPFVILQA